MSEPSNTGQHGWQYWELKPGYPASDGDISRQFDSGGSRPPNALRSVLPRGDAENSAALYSREGFANSIDAAPADQDFRLEVTFNRVSGSAAERLWDVLDLQTLADRSGRIERKDLGLSSTDVLSEGRGTKIRTMTTVEIGGGGMPGATDTHESVLADALYNVGFSNKRDAGALGSYGYGKAAVAQASRIRMIVVYTCFEPTNDDPVTRRLLGVTYWGQHSLDGTPYLGFAMFGHRHGKENEAAPLIDEDADELATKLGIPVRNPEVPDDRGTTFFIIEPGFEPEHLLRATELNWWPRLQNTRTGDFSLKVIDENGGEHAPEVGLDHPELGLFVRAFLAAEKARDADDHDQPLVTDESAIHIGEAGITSLMVCTKPDDVSLLAITRLAGMVVSYENVVLETKNPALRGIFVAHDAANDNLRLVEPHEHDKWYQQNTGALRAGSEDFEVSKNVRTDVRACETHLQAPDPEPVTNANVFSHFFPAANVASTKPTPPRPKGQQKQRLVRVLLVHPDADSIVQVERPTRLLTLDETSWFARAEVRFTLDEKRAQLLKLTSLDADITIEAMILDRDVNNRSGEPWPVQVDQRLRADEGPFERSPDTTPTSVKFSGRLEIGKPIYFQIETDPYNLDWTIALSFDCSPWDIAQHPADTEDQMGDG